MDNICESCQGVGEWALGDCEDGNTMTCPECEGKGWIDE